MPQLLPAAAAWAAAAWSSAVTATAAGVTAATAGAIAGTTATAVATAGLKFVVTTALSAAATALMRPNVPSTGTTLDFKPDPKAPVRGAMGYTAVGGNKAFQATWGYKRVAMSLGVALSLGPVDAITQFQADGVPVTFSGAQSEATGFYAADMWQKTTLGLPGDAALLPPTGLKYGNPGLTGWGVQNAAPQVAFAFWTMVLAKNPEDRDIFTNGVPDPRWIGRWMKVWNPRRDSTYPGGSGPQRRDDWRTWEWSENPYAHALAWYRGHFKLNVDGTIDRTKRIAGIGAPDAALDIPAFVEGMNVADANQWTISGEWASTDPKAQVAMAMLQAGGGQPINRGAQISVLVNMPRVSTYTYTKADLIGQATIRPLTPRRDRKNTIIPRFKSEANNWEYVAAGEVTDAGYRAEDRGEPRTVEVEYVHVRNAKQAGQLAAYDLVNLREGLTVTLPSKVHLMHVHAGDCITVDEPELAMVGQKFVVMRTTTDYKSATVTLELRSETDAKHAFALGQVAKAPPSPALSAVDPKYVPPPAAEEWTVVPKPPGGGGISQPIFVIELPLETSDIVGVIIKHGPSSVGPWTDGYEGSPRADGRYEITGLTPGQTYCVSLQYVVKNGAKSEPDIKCGIVAGDLTAGNVVPTAPTIVAMQDAIDAAEIGLGSLNAAIYTPGTGLLARSDAMFASLNTPTTGVLARLTAAETAITTNDTASTTRLVALEATVNTAETGLVARMGVQEAATANLATGKADASRVTALEAKVDTPGTGLLARMASQETATVDLQTQKADVSRVQLLEAFAAGGDGVMKDGGFQLWPAANARPDNVAAPTGLTISRQTTGLIYGDKAMRLVDPGTGNASFPIVAAGFAPASDALQWVVEYTVTINSGDLKRFGVQFRANRTTGYYGANVDLAAKHPATTTGATYRESQIFTVAPLGGASGAPTTCQAWFYTNLSSFSGGAFSAKDLTLHRLQFRPATPEEIATGSVLPDVASRVGTLETATANLQTGKADATRVTSLEATVNTPGTGVTARLTTVEGVAASANGTAKAIKGVVLNVNGYVSGYSSTNDGTTSAFEILASAFGIRDPGTGERTEYRAGNWYVYSPTENTRTRYGKAFGGTQKLVWWTGPTSVAEGSETKANAYVYMSQNTVSGPRFGGSDVPINGFHAQADFAVRIGSRTTAGLVTTSTVTISVTGNTGVVTYAWTQIGGNEDWTITTASGAATAFRVNVATPGEQKRAQFACVVTDTGSGRSFTIIVGAAALYNV